LTGVVRFVAGLALLVALNAACEWTVRALGIPVPGSVVGMLVLAACIEAGVVPLRVIRPAAELLVRHLALLYVPAGVALVSYVAVVRQDLFAITIAALASLVAVLAVIGLVMQHLGRDA
jgi:holin-like protein